MVSIAKKQKGNGEGRSTLGRFTAGNSFARGSNRQRSGRRKKHPPLPRAMAGRGLEDIWTALCDKALGGDQRALLEVFSRVDAPRESSESETEQPGELTDEDCEKDYELFEALPEDLQAMCVRNEWSPRAILDRSYSELPLSDGETLVAAALAAMDDED